MVITGDAPLRVPRIPITDDRGRSSLQGHRVYHQQPNGKKRDDVGIVPYMEMRKSVSFWSSRQGHHIAKGGARLNPKLFRYVKIFVGAALIGIALHFFLIPNNIVLGGVSGLTVILHYLTGIPAGVIFFGINFPVFLIAFRSLGKDYILHAFLGIALCSIIVDVLAFLPFVATSDIFLISIYSAVLIGFGVGLVLSANSSAGGSDIIARMVNKKRPDFSVGLVILIFDFTVVAIGVAVFRNLNHALYAFFTIFLLIQIINFVLSFHRHGKVCYIITEKGEEIQQAIVHILQQGATAIEAEGCYSGKEKNMLICVIRQKQEMIKLKRTVKEIDPDAFVIIHDAKEVFGQKFAAFDA